MGFLDLPAPALSWTDVHLAATVPDIGRLVLWGCLAAALSMGFYRLISPQRRLARLAAEERRLKDRLQDETAAMADGLAAAGRLLRLALLRLGLVLPPSVVAALPVLFLMAWLHTHYAYDLPAPDSAVEVRVEPDIAHARMIAEADEPPRVEVRDDQGVLLQSVQLDAPVPVIHKKAWWNALIGNPLGYLPDDAPIERVEIGLPERQYLPIGPDWARNWLAVFLATVLAGSLLLKVLFRIR